MKLQWILFGLLAASSSISFGARNYGMAGCGGGSIIVGKNGGQISAATSNATSYQSFAISSGTSNCIPDRKMSRAERVFINSNFVSFEKDVARGHGETLVALSELWGCGHDSVELVSKTLKGAYSDIFREPGAIASLIEAKDQLLSVEKLALECPNLS